VLDEIVREAARQMLAVALQAVVSAYIDAHAEEAAEKVSGGRQRTPPRRAGPCRRGIKNGKLIERPDESEGGDQQVARAVSGIRVSAAGDEGHDRHLTRPA
jgi:hypothetical protein